MLPLKQKFFRVGRWISFYEILEMWEICRKKRRSRLLHHPVQVVGALFPRTKALSLDVLLAIDDRRKNLQLKTEIKARESVLSGAVGHWGRIKFKSELSSFLKLVGFYRPRSSVVHTVNSVSTALS